MKRYGIFGGAFDPPHIAHSILADDVREQMHLDKIIFIPSGRHPLKEHETIAAEHRLNMSKLAFEDDENFEVSDIEIRNETGKSYTVDTLIQLKEKYKDDFVKLYLILGIDNLLEFPKWKQPEKLFLLSEVVIIARPNFVVQDAKSEYTSRVKFLSTPLIEISSSLIRDHVSHDKSIKYLVNSKVEKYIYDNNLYND
ncbi:MAG: nicotinate-nucleotide adenylyltransferase [Ignavibacteriae bacterium]|nr:nicotinate-nucleotide adenylyltransferase [Ignavibacteriota bacterium]